MQFYISSHGKLLNQTFVLNIETLSFLVPAGRVGVAEKTVGYFRQSNRVAKNTRRRATFASRLEFLRERLKLLKPLETFNRGDEVADMLMTDEDANFPTGVFILPYTLRSTPLNIDLRNRKLSDVLNDIVQRYSKVKVKIEVLVGACRVLPASYDPNGIIARYIPNMGRLTRSRLPNQVPLSREESSSVVKYNIDQIESLHKVVNPSARITITFQVHLFKRLDVQTAEPYIVDFYANKSQDALVVCGDGTHAYQHNGLAFFFEDSPRILFDFVMGNTYPHAPLTVSRTGLHLVVKYGIRGAEIRIKMIGTRKNGMPIRSHMAETWLRQLLHE